MPVGPEDAVRVSEIQQQKGDIRRGIEEIHKRIDSLEERLGSILFSASPSKEKEERPGLSVGLAMELSGMNDSIWNAVERLQNLYHRIDL